MTSLTPSAAADVLLTDGALAVIRRLRPDDAAALHALHNGVSDETLRMRFFAASRAAAHRYVEHVLSLPDRIALVAEKDGCLVGLATAEPVAPDVSEISFLVMDEIQGSGVGTLLLEHLAAAARDQGITRFTAEVLMENRRMLGVFSDAGFEVRRHSEYGDVIVDIDTVITPSLQAAVDAREAVAEAASLRPLLRPASVVLAGVRSDGTGVGAAILRAVLSGGYPGRLTVLHPSAKELQGTPAVPDIADVNGWPVDLLIMALPAPSCVQLLEASAGLVCTAVAISSGFEELGAEGARLQAALAVAARRSGIRLVGPNCLGIVANDPAVRLNATFSRTVPPTGGLAVASQSGAVGIVLMDQARRLGLGVGCFVSLGNKADVSGNDLLSAWSHDPSVTAAALYLESFGNARKFARLARRFSHERPLLVVVGGRSAGGQRAGLSHTAAAATPDEGVTAMFAQAGVIRCANAEDLCRTALVLTKLPLPAGTRIAVVSNGGGLAVLAADAATDHGLDVPAFSERLRRQLDQQVQGTGGTSNPVDTGAAASPAQVAATLESVIDSGEVDCVVVVLVATAVTDASSTIERVEAAARTRPDVPVILVPLGDLDVPPTCGLTVLDSAEAAVRALGRAATYRTWRDAEATDTAGTVAGQPPLNREVRVLARHLVEQNQGAWVGHAGSAALLKLCGVDVLGEVATGLDAAVTAAARCGYPVAVKAAEGVVHRTEKRLVRTNITSATELAEILREWESEPEGRNVVVQPMRAGTEIALGIVRDPVLGPLVMVAAGGTTVDVWDDRALLVPPISPRDAARAVRGLRAWRLLRGHRGAAAGDVAGLEGMIVALSQLALAVPEVAELDLNPVLVAPDGCNAVDVKLRLVESADPTNPTPRQLRPVPR